MMNRLFLSLLFLLLPALVQSSSKFSQSVQCLYNYLIFNFKHLVCGVADIQFPGRRNGSAGIQKLSAGAYQYQWNAKGFASGIYVYRIEADGIVQSKKLILLR